MKKHFYLIGAFLFALFISACISRSTPEGDTVNLVVGQSQTFTVTASEDIIWFLNDTEVGSGDSYDFSSSTAGTWTLTAIENTLSSPDSVSWTVTVSSASMPTWYEDSDLDGFGNPDVSQVSSDQPNGYVLNNEDCNDSDRNSNPDGIEICGDGIDQDCDGMDLECEPTGCQSCHTACPSRHTSCSNWTNLNCVNCHWNAHNQ